MISTKGRYALRVMIDLAQHREEGFVSLKLISERQNISVKYLEAIIAPMIRAGIVESQRGKTGGYRLSRTPDRYSVAEILRVTDVDLAPVACLACDDSACEREDHCLTLPMWRALDRLIEDYLAGVTLADLISGDLPTPCAGCSASRSPGQTPKGKDSYDSLS